MPIKFAQNNQYDEGGFEDALLYNFMIASQGATQAAERRGARRDERAYRAQVLNMQRNQNAAANAYRDRMAALAEAQDLRSAELQPFTVEQAKAAAGASRAQEERAGAETEQIKLQTDVLKIGKEREAEQYGRQTQERGFNAYATGGLAKVEAESPFALDIDTTFSDAQLLDLDPANGQKWIDIRNEAKKRIGLVVQRLESLRPGAGAEFKLKMDEANLRADAGSREAFSKKGFFNLEND
jgi:hypothetical protein